MQLHALTVGLFRENAWFLHDAATDAVVLVDPGDEGARLIAEVERLRARVEAVWITHAHLDHIGALADVKRRWPSVPVHGHPADAPVWAHASRVAAGYGLPFDQPEPPDRALADGDQLVFGGVTWDVWHLPGHAPGHVAFIGGGHCVSGDVLFRGGVGRTDLPLCDPLALQRSLERMATLPPETVVHPGHGPDTTIGDECAMNAFLNGAARLSARAPAAPS